MKNSISNISLVILLLLSTEAISQTSPTGSPPFPATNQRALAAWYRGGNNATGGTNNIFGTVSNFNSGIFTQTNGTNRMRLNGDVSYPVNGFAAAPKNGFLLLGANNNVTGGSLYTTSNRGAFSLLHLSSGIGSFAQEGGFRPWMSYGITSTHNQDFMFMGQRATNGIDVTDAVFGWADNGGGGNAGPDNMVFSFFAGNASQITLPNGDLTGTSNFGREVVRYTASGQVGIGPRFNNANQPKSTLHQHQENNSSSWMQITNQYLTTPGAIQTGPTAIGANNGLRWGIIGDGIKARNGNAFIYNQENRQLIFSTNNVVPTNAVNTNERVRIGGIFAPTKNPAGTYVASFNPGAVPVDATHVGISYLPQFPVTAPLSLVHLGANTSSALDGWRRWMEVGTFIGDNGNGTNYYNGIKFAPAAPLGPRDVVLGWGYTPANAAGGGTKMRFIFTSTSGGPLLSGSANGLEAGHFWSDGNNTRLGIGDFAVGDPLNTLEIKPSAASAYFPNLPGGCSGLKFRNLNALISIPIVNPGPGVLAVDNTGNVIYVKSSGGSSLGNICGGPSNPLPIGGWEIPLNLQNFWFAGNGGPTQDRVGIGFTPGACTPLRARLHVVQNSGFNNDWGILSENNVTDGVALIAASAGGATGPQTKVAGVFRASPAAGGQQVAIYVPAQQGLVNIGYPTPSSAGAGGLLNVNGPGAFNGDVYPVANCNPSQRCGNPTNRWFEVWSCNGAIQTSDERLKENIKPLSYGLKEIMKLKPISYTWKGNSDYGNKIGFVAQQLKEVVSEVVKEGDDIDKTLGVNYAELVPVLIKGIQEQQKQIEEGTLANAEIQKQLENQKKISDELQSKMDKLEQMINACCSSNSVGGKGTNTQAINLSDKHVIVLNQNVPNPFAEQTTITYSIPFDYAKAQIIFIDNSGKVISTFDVKEKGEGKLNVFANDLTNGTYSYSLVVDGKVIDTKKMIKSN